jgi:CheY-like chemotaxis protein
VLIASIIDDQPLGYVLGATDYLVKPIDREVLLARLARYALMSRSQPRAATVLVVDDDPGARDLLAAMLEPANFNVIQASSGAAALDLMRSRPPDVVLLDLMMPEVSGFDVVTSMRLDPATSDIPVFIVTAMDLAPKERERLNGSVAGVFTKASMNNHDLLTALRQLVAREPVPEKLSRATL